MILDKLFAFNLNPRESNGKKQILKTSPLETLKNTNLSNTSDCKDDVFFRIISHTENKF